MSITRISPKALTLLGGLSATLVACSLPSILASYFARCHAPPPTFSEATIVGTWMAGVPDQNDTLVISADGTYTQRIHVEFTELPPLDYLSETLPWYLDYSDEGIPYLHLTGYAFCGMNPEIPCDTRDGGGYDICRDEWIEMRGEGILLVLATSAPRPRWEEPVYYYLHYPLGSENSYVYSRQDDQNAP